MSATKQFSVTAATMSATNVSKATSADGVTVELNPMAASKPGPPVPRSRTTAAVATPAPAADTVQLTKPVFYGLVGSVALALLLAIIAIAVAAGSSGSGSNTSLGANEVTSTTIAPDAVGTAALANGAITTDKISSSAVTSYEIASNAVGSSEIADDAVTSAAIAADAVTAAKIASNAVTSDKLADNAVTSAKLGASSVTSAKIGADAVTFPSLNAGFVPVNPSGWRGTGSDVGLSGMNSGSTQSVASTIGPNGYPIFLYAYAGSSGSGAGLRLAMCIKGNCRWSNLYSTTYGSKYTTTVLLSSQTSGIGKVRVGMTSTEQVGVVFYQDKKVKFRTCTLPCTTFGSPYTLYTAASANTYTYLDAAFTNNAAGIVISSGTSSSGTITYIYDRNSYSTKTTTIATGSKYDGQVAITWRSDKSTPMPIIAYTVLGTNTEVKLIVCDGSIEYCCASSGCTLPTAISLSTETGTGSKTAWMQLQLDRFGFPMAGYVRGDYSNAQVVSVSCGSMSCTSPTKTQILTNFPSARSYTTRGFDMTSSPVDSSPVFVFVDTNYKLWLARCTDGQCASTNVVSASMVGAIDTTGAAVAVSVSPWGFPIIGNGAGYGAAVEVLVCPNVRCTEQPQPW